MTQPPQPTRPTMSRLPTCEPLWTLETTDRTTCLSFTSSKNLVTGSDDGCVRLYSADSPKVSKAIKGLGSEVGALVCVTQSGKEHDNVWVAIQHKAFLFNFDSPKMILSLADTSETLVLGEHEEDALNEITLSSNKKTLAYTTDAGTVGVVDLSTKKPFNMKVKHANISWAVKFIPDRPSEMVSGGYDCALLHFDFVHGGLLSKFDFTAPPPESGISLSPPFVMSMAMSSSGIIATGTADGRIWIGTGGDKRLGAGAKKKRSRKWEGLREEEGLSVKVAEGPVVGLAFLSADTLVSSTLLGTVTQYQITRTEANGTLELTATWSQDTKALAKVNAIAISENRIAIGGIGRNAKGVVEVWEAKRA